MLPLEEMIGDLPWRRLYLDLPWAEGSGSSTATSALEVAQGVLDVIDSRLGDGSFAIIGNSFGGMIARHVAHERRERVLGLATLASVVEPDHGRRVLPPRTVLVREDGVLERAGEDAEDYDAVGVVQDDRTLTAFIRHVRPGLRGADQEMMERIAQDYGLPRVPESSRTDPFTAPSLHVLGRQDDVVGYEDGLALREHYPRGTYAVLDCAGHNVHLEQPETVGALLRDWLRRMEHGLPR
jgi:pimeloyl-ACP methyl ester carboxylesterase